MMRFASLLHRLWSNTWFRLLVAGLLILFVNIESTGSRNDLDIFLAAANELFAKGNIYATTFFDGYHYYYSVLFATIIYPLTHFDPAQSKALWMLLNIAALIRIWKLMFRFIDVPWMKAEMKTLFGFVVLIFCLRFIKGNLHLGQMTILMLWLSLESINQLYNGKKFFGSVLLALAINVKLLPIVLIPYLIWRREWLAAIYTCALLIVFLILPALWLGNDYNLFLLNEYFALINPVQHKHVLDVSETSFHSLTTFFAVYFTDNPPEHLGLEASRSIASLSIEQLHILVNVVRLFLIILTIRVLRSQPFTPFSNRIQTWWELSYLLLLIPLIFPHQQHYAFMMCMPASAYVIFRWIQNYRLGNVSGLKFFLIGIVYLTFNLSMLLGVYTAWYNHYKILTLGTLVLLVLMIATPPEKMKTEIV